MSRLKIKHLGFIRDLGGIKTNDGKRVVKGKLYRSSTLSKLEDDDALALKEHINLNQIIDFRTTDEETYAPDTKINGTQYFHAPALSNEDNPIVNKYTRKEVLKQLYKQQGGTKAHLKRVYRKLISSDLAINSYKIMLRQIIENPDDTFVWHCSQGKDRTGVFTVILLLSLGIDKDTIMKDYLAYNKSCRFKNVLIFIGICLISFNVKMAKGLHNLLVAKKEYLEECFDEINSVFGSTENYLHKILNLSDEDIDKLKNTYLI